MIVPFITELLNEPAETEQVKAGSEPAGNLLSGDNIFSVKFQSMVKSMEENSAQDYKKDEREINPETEMSFSEKYDLILKRIEKERFERELLAGSR